jgi:signal transduction histidine kinase/ligand-binding sensor domain-containing protein
MFRRLAAAGLVCLGPAAFALDPGRAPSQYVLTRWGQALPSVAIHSLVQTQDRRLWLGTTIGLVQFDGASFVVFDAQNTPGLEGGISGLAEARDGTLFLGTTAGTVLAYRGGAVTSLNVPAGSSFVSALLAARDGSLWVGLHGRDIQRYADGASHTFPALHGLVAPPALVQDKDGVIWIGTRRMGLVRYDGTTFTRYLLGGDRITALCPDRAGDLWIGTPHGLLRRHGDDVERFTRANGLSDDRISALLEDRDGNLWVGTAHGLSRRAGLRWEGLTTAEGLSDDDVRCLLEDHEGNLWVGTADGLNGISNGRFVTYGQHEGLREPAVSAVAPAKGGGVWLGLESGAVARLGDDGLHDFPLPTGLGRDAPVALREMRDGALWIVQDNGRVFRLQRGVVTEHTPDEPDPNKLVRAFLEDDHGPVLVASQIGPARLQGRHLLPIPPAEAGRFLRYLHAAYDRPDGSLWFCDRLGLSRFQDGQWRRFTTRDGLPHDRVRAASFDEDGSVWLATAGGLARLAGGRIQALTAGQGLPENYLRLVLDDRLGHLWIASMGRIFRVDKEDVREVLAGRRARVSPIVFDASDGLRSTEGLLGNAPGFRAADGRLWFATAKGVSVIDPARLVTDEPAPPVRLARVRIDARPAMIPANVATEAPELPPGRGEVTIDYAALSYHAPNKLRFRHRLDGLDRDWVDAGSARRAYYSALPPGRYRFEVMASNRDGLWNGATASFAFVLRPPLHRRPIFFAGCLLAALLLGAIAHHARARQVHARLAAVIEERTRIARELHDTLAQGLAGVKLQIDNALDSPRPEVARRAMRFARSMVVSSLAEVRRSIWVLRAQAAKGPDGFGASLNASLRQLTGEAGLQSTVHVTGTPRILDAEVERNLLRIAHEAVTNAVRHAGAKTVEVEMEYQAEALRLRVRDDGHGFEPQAYLQGASGEHFGLLGIVERARWMGGELHVESRAGAGTEVSCRLPYDGRAEPPASGAAGAPS